MTKPNNTNKWIRIYKLFWGPLIVLWAVYKMIRPDDLPVPLYLIFLAIGLLLTYWGISSYRKSPTHPRKGIAIFFTVFTIAYIFFECIANFPASNEEQADFIPDINSGFGVFNEPCAVYDSIRGYRWLPGAHRIAKVLNNQVIYDQVFSINNKGFYSKDDFSEKKASTDQKRYILFGDSFTSGEYLKTPLGDRCNQLFIKDSSNIAVLPFAINGGGLFNWHNILFKEIIGHYDFDGIVLNIFGNDLSRGFFTMNHQPTIGTTGYFDTIPTSLQDYMQNYVYRSNPYAPYLSDSIIDHQIDSVTAKAKHISNAPDLYLIKGLVFSPLLIMQMMESQKFTKAHFVRDKSAMDLATAKAFIGEQKYALLKDMVDYCKTNHKTMVFAQLPYQIAIDNERKGWFTKETLCVKVLADHFGVIYFDGTAPFSKIDKEKLQQYFLPYETHWNQKGADLYAGEFSSFLMNL